jgi:signal transduction histidine kinase
MSSPSLVLTFENDSSLAGRQLRWLVYFWNAFYLAAFILTLSAVLWNTPTPWGRHETALMVIVSLQVVLYIVFFYVTHHSHWPLTWPWLTAYFVVSFGLWLVLWRLEASFWWIIWAQMLQFYISVPLKVAIPAAGLIFFVVVHFDNGVQQLLALPLNEAIGRLIPWIIFSTAFSFVASLTRANLERARLIAELQAARQKLELVHQQELELATLRERERLARDMHDSLGHALVTLSVQLEAVQRLYPVNPEGALNQINELKSLIRTSMDGLRRTLAGLRAPGLENRPLSQALHDLSREISQRTGLEITCQTAAEIDQLNPVVGEALWRVTQEALMNVEKHAAACHVQIDLQMRPEAITLWVVDDGVGLPPDASQRPGHYGLRGMRERIEGLGGTLTLRRNGQKGTMLEACLPLIGRSARPQEA